MSYKFNALSYDMLSCVGCGAGIPLTMAAEQARVQTADGAQEVPGLWVCRACESHASHVEQIAAFVWLTGTLIPEGLKFAVSVAKDDNTDLMTAISGLMIAQDVDAANKLASVLARELAGIPAEQPQAAPQAVPDPMPAGERGPELASLLDMRREADGTVSYACPNPVCPVGRHNLAEFADALPIEIVNALIGALPE